jgi:hypothetical protein
VRLVATPHEIADLVLARAGRGRRRFSTAFVPGKGKGPGDTVVDLDRRDAATRPGGQLRLEHQMNCADPWVRAVGSLRDRGAYFFFPNLAVSNSVRVGTPSSWSS